MTDHPIANFPYVAASVAVQPSEPAPHVALPGPCLEALPDNLRIGLTAPKLPGLDGLRAICAALVVLSHLGVPRVSGSMGVLAFFVLSGFLITWLLLAEEARSGTVSLSAFYMRRTLRIFPAFYVYWIIAVGLAALLAARGGKPVDIGQAGATLLYVSNYWQAIFGDSGTVLSHAWSLAVEEQFYLLWPWVFLRLPAARRLTTIIALIAIVIVHRAIITLVVREPEWAYAAFDCRADHLLVGCGLAVALWQGRASGVWRWLCVGPARMALVTAVLVLSSQGTFFIPHYRNLVGFVLDPLLVAALIVQAIASPGWRGTAWLHHRWLGTLGGWSYSTYLYQQLAAGVAHRMVFLPLPLRLVAGIVLTYGAAALSHRWVERPFLRLKKRWERPRGPQLDGGL